MEKLKARTGIVAAKAELKRIAENEVDGRLDLEKFGKSLVETKADKKKKSARKKLKGLAGIAKAVASTDNIKTKGRNLYAEFCFERDWEGMDSFEHGVVGPGYFKRIREREKKFSKLGNTKGKNKNKK